MEMFTKKKIADGAKRACGTGRGAGPLRVCVIDDIQGRSLRKRPGQRRPPLDIQPRPRTSAYTSTFWLCAADRCFGPSSRAVEPSQRSGNV